MADGELFHPVKLKSFTIPGNLFLAPLAGYTDRAFRHICIDNGASFTYTEMVSCEGIIRANKKTVDLMEPADNEKLFGIQIFTSVPDKAARAVELAAKFQPTLFDLNCGCPAPKIVKTGAGAALLRDPEKLGKIVKRMREVSNIPITVKIRSGWDFDSINYRDTAAIAIEAGAELITLHSRTRSQGYSGAACLEHVRDLKNQMQYTSVPVIASGDVFSPQAVANLMKTTKCDGVIFARGALGHPFIFEKTKEFLITGTVEEPNLSEIIKIAVDHLDYAIKYLGESRACKEMKKHFCAYTKGMPGGASLRNKIVHVQNVAEYKAILADYEC